MKTKIFYIILGILLSSLLFAYPNKQIQEKCYKGYLFITYGDDIIQFYGRGNTYKYYPFKCYDIIE